MSRPSVYPLWTDGDPLKVTQPDASTQLAGWVPGEPPPADYVNWLLWITGQWISYLDQSVNSDVSIYNSMPLTRLLGGGTWSWNLTTGTLAWSGAFNLSIPSIADANNQAAAGSIALADGQVAYVQANIPFTAACNTTSGSNVLTNIPEAGSIASGQQVTGTGIPGGTTTTGVPVQQSDGTFHVSISANATANGAGVSLTFSGNGALTVSTAAIASLVPSQTTVIIARRDGNFVFVGVNASYMKLRDLEARFLEDAGYAPVFNVLAGENLTQGQAIYISNGDGGRTSGRAYKTDVSAANGLARSWFAGFVITSATTGNTVLIATGGALPLFTSLAFGTAYYLDPSTNGGITATKPTVSGQFIVPIGVASSSTVLQVKPGSGAEATPVSTANAYPNYFVTSSADLDTAISSATSNGGGVICLLNSFTVSAAKTIPVGTVLLGRKGGSIITLTSTGSVTLSDGAECKDVWFATALTSGDSLKLPNNYSVVRGCQFTVPAAGTNNCINVTGNANTMFNNTFIGVAGETAVGINYAAGVDNEDYYSVFLA